MLRVAWADHPRHFHAAARQRRGVDADVGRRQAAVINASEAHVPFDARPTTAERHRLLLFPAARLPFVADPVFGPRDGYADPACESARRLVSHRELHTARAGFR